MGAGMLIAMTLPGLVLALIALALIERIVSATHRRSLVTRTRRMALSGSGMDVFASALLPGKESELEHREAAQRRVHDATDAAPPTSMVDLDAGTAVVRIRATDPATLS